MKHYSTEIKAILDKKKVRSRINPENSINLTMQTQQPVKNMKRCQSAVSLRRKDDLTHLTQKYKLLEENYRKMLYQSKSKLTIYNKLKQTMDILHFQHIRDQNQIAQLRGILGFMPKQQKATQTIINSTFHQQNKIEHSTQSGDNSDIQFNENCLKKRKMYNITSPQRKIFSTESIKSPRKQRPINKKYKFIPTLPLK